MSEQTVNQIASFLVVLVSIVAMGAAIAKIYLRSTDRGRCRGVLYAGIEAALNFGAGQAHVQRFLEEYPAVLAEARTVGDYASLAERLRVAEDAEFVRVFLALHPAIEVALVNHGKAAVVYELRHLSASWIQLRADIQRVRSHARSSTAPLR